MLKSCLALASSGLEKGDGSACGHFKSRDEERHIHCEQDSQRGGGGEFGRLIRLLAPTCITQSRERRHARVRDWTGRVRAPETPGPVSMPRGAPCSHGIDAYSLVGGGRGGGLKGLEARGEGT